MSHIENSPYASPLAEGASATSVRWRIMGLVMAYVALCHFNRVSISVAGTERMMEQYGISETRMGMVYSAYLLVYTLCMTPGGWFIDRFGPRAALVLMGFGSAMLVAVTGLVGFLPLGAAMVLPLLMAVRGGVGMFTAPIHPSAARIVSFWLPMPIRAMGNGLATGAALLGIASTYYGFGFLIDRFDWPTAFLLAAAATIVVACVWTWYAKDRPAEHPSVNAAELSLINGPYAAEPADTELATVAASPSSAASSRGAGSTLALLADRNLLLLTTSYAAVGYFEYLFFYWMQFYFDDVLGLGKDLGRFYATIPTLAMAVGMFLGGGLADRLELAWGRRRGRAFVPVAGMIGSAVLCVLGTMSRNPLWVVTCFALAMAAVGASEGPFWTTAVEIGGRRGGTSAAIFNTGGNAGGILAPVVTPLFSVYFGWQGGIALAGLFCVLGAALWYWIDVRPDSRTTPTRL